MAGPLDEALLSRYLLNDCSEEEKARVEEQFFASSETFERLCQLEEDLIARYGREELTGPQAAQFERAYGMSSRRRERVLLNVALGRFAAEGGGLPAARAADERVQPRAERPAERSGRAHFVDLPAGLRFGLAAAGITLAAALAFQIQRVTEMRGSLEAERRQAESLRQQIAAAEQRVLESERQVAALGDEVNRAREAQAGSDARPLVAAFLLSPGLTRGAREPARVRVPAGVDTVRLQLDLEQLSYRAFRAELRTAAGDIGWAQDALQPRAIASGRVVSVDVPAALVPAGEYELILSGLAGPGTFEDAAHYYFEVVRP
jgi:hypothetical protein